MATNPNVLAFPSPLALRLLDKHSPHEIAEAIEVLIDVLDALGGDPEAEEDELEDAFVKHDPAFAYMEPGATDQAWVEWHTMHPAKKRGPNFTAGQEDDEEDDPSGQCDEDGVNTDFATTYASAPGCIISDSDYCGAWEDKGTAY